MIVKLAQPDCGDDRDVNRMSAALAIDTAGERQVSETSVAGLAAVCDPLGALYLPDLGALIVSDLHLEKAASFARKGMMLPPYDTAVTLKLLDAVIGVYDPRIVVSLGDSFHDGKCAAYLPPVFREKLSGLMAGRDWIWITGNHDPEAPVDLPGDTAEMLALGPVTLRHAPNPGDTGGEIAGHLHPYARVVRRGKGVRRACFAGDDRRLVMPAFGTFTGGLDIRHRAFRGLFDLDSLVAHVLGRERTYAIRYANLCA